MGFEIGDLLHGDLRSVIEAIGLIGIFAIVFLESGRIVIGGIDAIEFIFYPRSF